MMLLGSLVNMLAIFAGCFVGVTLGRFIPERFNSAIEKGIALCVFYIGLDGVLYFLGFKDSYLGEQGKF